MSHVAALETATLATVAWGERSSIKANSGIRTAQCTLINPSAVNKIKNY